MFGLMPTYEIKEQREVSAGRQEGGTEEELKKAGTTSFLLKHLPAPLGGHNQSPRDP